MILSFIDLRKSKNYESQFTNSVRCITDCNSTNLNSWSEKLFSTLKRLKLKPKDIKYQLILTLTAFIFYLKLVLDKGKVQTFKPMGVFPEGLWQEH